MNDKALIAFLMSSIIAGESVAGIAGTPIKSAFQPTNQGANIAPTAYMFKIADKNMGSPQRKEVWDSVNLVMTHTENQKVETLFQISALAIQAPDDTIGFTASDILNLIASIVRSDTFIGLLKAQNLGILRVGDIRNPTFLDDKNRYEFSPSFDFTIVHERVIVSTSPFTEAVKIQILTV